MGKGTGPADKNEEPLDRRLEWLVQRFNLALKMKPGELKKLIDNEDNRALLMEFLDTPDRRNVFIAGTTSGAYTVITGEYEQDKHYDFRKKIFYFMKTRKEKMLDEKTMIQAIQFGDLSVDTISALHTFSRHVALPLIEEKDNVTTVPDVYYTDLMEKTHSMLADSLMTLGRSKHRTLLPIPPIPLPKNVVHSKISKDVVYALESAVTGWTTSIKGAMSATPEELREFLGRWPGPLDEIQFWREKMDNLQQLEEQLCQPFITKATIVLKMAESSYYPSFSALSYELHNALLEASENYRFLKPLTEYFEAINVESPGRVPFENLVEQGTFKTIFHMLYLVWKHAGHYNSVPRMVLLITEVANDLIESAKETIDPASLFNPENEEIIRIMTRVLTVCGEFKRAFFDYKARTVREMQRAWRFQNTALFRRLDAFLERCHDLLDMLETAQLFDKVANIRIGGTDSGRLTDEVDGIKDAFFKEYFRFQAVEYDVLDIDDRQFERDYDVFRGNVQRFEERLATVMSSAIGDSSGIGQLFKVVDSFDGFTERPVVHQEWSSKQAAVLNQWQEELLTVQDHFLTHKDNPIVLPNMPATTCAIIWGQSLLARLSSNAPRIQDLNKALLHSDLGEETTRLHEQLRTQIRQYIQATYDTWAGNVGQASADKLRSKLLLQKGENEFAVNFDPHLVRTLKEVIYLEQLTSEHEDAAFIIPPQVVTLNKSRETLRTQVLRLDYVCETVNNIRKVTIPSEQALLEREVGQLNANLMRGVDELQWYTSDVVDQYIADVVQEVSQLDDVVSVLHRNLSSIAEAIRDEVKEDNLLPLIPSKSDVRILTETEFKKRFAEHISQREAKVKEISDLLDAKMASSLETLNTLKRTLDIDHVKADAGVWVEYLEHVTNEVNSYLVKSTVQSLTNLRNQLDPQWLQEHGGIPLLDIKLIMTRPRDVHTMPQILFEPVLRQDQNTTHSLESLFETVMERILNLVDNVRQVDPAARSANLSFMDGVVKDSAILNLQQEIRELISRNADKCEDFVSVFQGHSYLYEKNTTVHFNEFLEEAAERHAAIPDEDLNLAVGEKRVVPYFDGVPLEDYDAEIRKYEDLHDTLEDLPMSFMGCFVKIDSKPVRSTILDLCSKWRDVFLNHLTNKIRKDLNELYEFIAEAEKGLQEDVIDGDLDSLKSVMRCIRDCRRKNQVVSVMLDPVSRAITMLRQHPTISAEVIEEIDELRKPAQESWNTMYRKSLNTREQNSNAQDREAERMKEDTAEFEDKIAMTGQELRVSQLYRFELDSAKSYDHIDGWNRKFLQLEDGAKSLWDLQELFELTPSEFRELRDCRAELVMLKHVWDLVNHVTIMFKDWMTSPFMNVDVDGFLDEIKKLNKQLKGQPMKARSWQVYKGLEETVQNMSMSLPLCSELRSPAMRDRHWKLLLKAANVSGSIDPEAEDFTLEKLIALGIHKYSEDVYNIVEKAQKELQIERSLTKIVDAWEKMAFEYEFNGQLDIHLLAPIDAVVEQLEADSNTLQSMLSNRFVEEFLDRVQHWQRNLGNVDTCMNKWIEIQRKWVNLFPIFVLSADIREQLPEDAKNFQVVDDMFRKMMTVAHEYTNVIEVICSGVVLEGLQRSDDLEAYLTAMEDILVGCEKSLSEYLETKRKIFPRFFFVSSADLVDILSKGSDPRAVMVHMSKIVDAVETFTFDNNPDPETAGPKTVWEMISVQGEQVKLSENYDCEGPVENWLAGCISTMQKTMKYHIQDANAGYVDKPRTEWIYQYPCQAVIVASRSWFTTEAQGAFQMLEEGTETAMKDFLKMQKTQLDTLIKEVLTDRTNNERKMLVHLITIDVHNRDIIQSLVDDRIDNVEAFAWQSQLRYYWDDARGSEVKICDAEFANGYEYIGLCGCLVITKLTDRCYTTLSQALRLKKGGAPAGPAGTGKTETTKDLARNLGIACYVFNCSDQMNYITLGQIFKGLAMSGSWGCFDEFNRISIEVLSVVATQVNSILNALKGNKKRFRFMDEEISVVNSVGMFITMNPGYAGRTELPENIKSLFRPCAMCVPDLKNICEIMLAAEGFGDAKDLALKFVTLYRLNKELLSAQDHYDWGLRAVKSVLYIAGALKRGDPDVPERKVLMRALRDTNLAKLSKDDVYVFMGLIRSLFPQLEAPKKDKPELVEALKTACKEMGNFPGENDIFILKCMQYEEILHVRHSVFILGPAGCGKTQCWKCLQKGLHILGDKCATHPLNPKAITSNELYGFIHPQTKEWRDGVLSNVFRQFALESKTKKNSKWIVLDGIIDAEWIESMNTVMDDNKMLTLVSNERIPLTESMRMIFEVSHLKNASPATVSRGGVVFINETDLGWGPFKDKWLATREDREATFLETMFDRYVPTVFEYWKRACKTVVSVMDISVIQTICNLLEGLLSNLREKSVEVYEKYFVFALIWAFGGPLPSDGRVDYRVQFSNFWRKENPHLKIGEVGTVFDFFIDPEDNYEFKQWQTLVTKYEHDVDVPLSNVSVKTADTVRMTALMSLLVDHGKPVMLVGTAGTGKSNLILSKLRSLDSSSVIFRTIAFNARTNSAGLQSVMEQSLEKRSGRTYGPINRKKLIFFLDDVNMPNPDKYGTQEAIALLQQQHGYGFWYDRVKIIQKEIVDIRYVGAMNPKSGTFTILDRLLRHFALFSTNMPDRQDLVTIYGQILSAHFTKFSRDVKVFTEALTNATIELHLRVTKEFLPTAILFHYQWNMRELFNIFQGLCNSNIKLHNDPSSMVRLWAHECVRTFQDRMPRDDDIMRFDDILAQVRSQFFSEISAEDMQPRGLWAPFRTTKDGDEGVYDECESEFTSKYLLAKLADYNNQVSRMELVLFNQAIEHVCRICRITANPRGNALLVGVGGSGKQSLARLASFINGLDIFQIQVTGSYGIADFRTDMQEVYRRCGLKGQPYSFIITDQQIVSMDMLVYLNDMLSSGNVPDLFVGDERDGVIGSIMNEVKASGHPDYSNPDVCWEFFIDKVRSNLHIILCFSPVGKTFAAWCRQFPALANTTVIDWFHSWPEEALRSVASRFLNDLTFEDAEKKDEMIENIADFMSLCQQEVTRMGEEFFAVEKRRCYTTPKSFLELIELYKDLLDRKRGDVQTMTDRLMTGIDKIKEAGEQVADLQEVLITESAEVEEAREKTSRLMEHVSHEKSIVEDQSAIAGAEEAKTNKIVQEVEAFAAECAKDLAAAKPLVDEAMAALNTLDRNSLTELKSMSRPPEDVVMVCAAVRVLTSAPTRIPPPKGRDWQGCKQMMGNVTQWMKDLQAFDQDNIPQPCIDAIQMYVSNPAFDPNSVVTKSFAASGLCKWVIGMNEFHKVRCQVRPKEERLAEAQERLTQSRAQLKRVQDKVNDLQAKLDVLMAQYNEALETSNQIEAKAQKTKNKMSVAERLVGGLADEKVRWGQTIEDLKKRSFLLTGDVLLASAFVSYVGPFTRQFRDKIVDEVLVPAIKERQIPMTKDLDVVMNILTTEADVASWNNEGLPNDTVSTQNGSIITNCARWPLMIDPQLQGVRWIRNREEKKGLIVVQPGQKLWLNKIVQCIEDGLPCLIEGCGDTLDPVLDNVLGRVTYRRGQKTFIKVGSNDVEYNKKFRLFLQTKLSNPEYKPEVNAQTTLINFMVTESGLEDQLLAVVVNQERPDLEEKRTTLLRHMNMMTIELQQCEDGLLFELSNATGDILENVALVDNLEATKRKATEINKAMVQARQTQETIVQSRLIYQPVATRGSLLFFQLDQLCKIDHMYQYSLEAFMVVFNKALSKAEQPADPKDVETRVNNVTNTITENAFSYVARGMFERHKLIFSALLTFAILSKANVIDRRHLDFLLSGRRKTGAQERPETVAEWCPEPNWCAVLALADVEGTTPAFSTLPADMAESNRWRLWCESEKPEEEKMPTDWKNLTQFQRLLVLRCLRPDRLTTALENFVASQIGRFFVSDQAVDVSVSFKDAGTTTPLFFILSPGVDPVKNVEALGQKLGYTYDNERLFNVSLGQGQEIVAERALEKCFKDGGWAMLNNVHLVEKWLRKLEKMMESYSEIYTKMAQVAKAQAERRNARRMVWLNEQEALKAEEKARREAAGETDEREEDEEREPTDGSERESEGEPDEPNFESEDENEDEANIAKGSLDFRIFLSAEPSTSIPVGILQRSIKLTSEPPTGISQNIKRAMMNFVEEPWEKSSKPTEFRAVMFAMCFFHAVVVERKKFGPQGWNRVYPFNVGDLTTCVDVLGNYIDDRPKIPWEDLRYVFGEIMYGGHITDDRDRVLCMAYLEGWIVPEVVDGVELAPNFSVPGPLSYSEYHQYVDDNCPHESPVLYGLHPNAEINFRSVQADVLFRIITELQPRQASTGDTATPAEIVRSKVEDLLEKLPEQFNLADIAERLDEDRTPPQHVFYQECERMNLLMGVMKGSLQELLLGLQGALSMSVQMQELFDELLLDKLPTTWNKVSFASMRALASWFDNMNSRWSQLNDWTGELATPKVTIISYFFNPMSLLTAIMQLTSITNNYDLDQMTLVADVTKRVPEQIDVPARDAAHLYGMHMEGARWDTTGSIEDSRMKELYPKMPVITVRSVPISKVDRRDQYECPMYKTQARGPGYVVGLWLRTKQPARKWVIAGVGLILDVVE